MAVKTRLLNDEKNEGWNGLDDLDAVFLEQMKEQGIDESLLQAFASSALASNEEHARKENGEADE